MIETKTKLKTIAVLSLLGTPSYALCFSWHICRDGHLAHGPYPLFYMVNDLWWIMCFVAVCILSIHLAAKRAMCFFLASIMLILSRILLDSGGGGYFIFELLLLVVMDIYAVKYLVAPGRYIVSREKIDQIASILNVILTGIVIAVLIAVAYFAYQNHERQHPKRLRSGASEEWQKQQARRRAGIYVVDHVIDGDTIKLANGKTVRLIGIDAPLITGKDKMGQEAAEFLKRFLVPGDEVIIDFDVQKRDKDGRLLGYVFNCPVSTHHPSHKYIIQRDKNQKPCEFYNAKMIFYGYAQPMPIPPNMKYSDLFEKLFWEAREAKRGLWKDEEGQLITNME